MKPNINSGFFTRRHGKTEAQLRGHRPEEAAAIEAFIAKNGVTHVTAASAYTPDPMGIGFGSTAFGPMDCLSGSKVRGTVAGT